MNKNAKYYEFYAEIIKSNVFFKRLVIFLVGFNLVLAYLSFLGFTRPSETFVIKDGYAYATQSQGGYRTAHEVRRFSEEFATSFLEYNRENFNERFKNAMKMCTIELERFMHEAVTNSDIPKIVKTTTGTIKFTVEDIRISGNDPFDAYVIGKQIFPQGSTIPIRFSLKIMVVPRTRDNPFGLRIINYIQEKK